MLNNSSIFAKHLITGFIICALSFTAISQPPQKSKREQIRAQKVAFITQKVDLTPEEAAAFWPIYNEYDKKRLAMQASYKDSFKIEKLDIDQLTEEEATKIADNNIILGQKMLDLRKEYYIRYKSVLPIKKILKLQQAEKEFQRVLLQQIRQQNKNRRY